MNPSIEKFLHGGMLVLNESAPAQQAARAMYERNVGSVIVHSKDGKMVGVVTDRDLSNQVLALGYPPETPIGELMASDICSITENDSLQDAIQLMEDYGVRRIPVVSVKNSGKERCVGLICLDDLVAERVVDLDTLSRIVSKQILKPIKPVELGSEEMDVLQKTLDRFYDIMSEQTHISRSQIEEVTVYFLKTMIQRLPSSGAAQLIAQLPLLLQDELMSFRSNLSQEAGVPMFLNIENEFGMTPQEAELILDRFWDALDEFTFDLGGRYGSDTGESISMG